MTELQSLYRQPGQSISLSDWNALLAHVIASTPRGQGIQRGVDGTLIPRRAPRSYAAVPHPFQIFSDLRIQPGTVDGIMAKIGETALDAAPAPKLTPAAGVNRVVALKLTWEPAAFETTEGEFYLAPGGTLLSLAVEQFAAEAWPPEETMPAVSSTGETTNGIFYQRVGRYTAIDQGGTVVVQTYENDTLRHSLSAGFCPPAQLSLSIL